MINNISSKPVQLNMQNYFKREESQDDFNIKLPSKQSNELTNVDLTMAVDTNSTAIASDENNDAAANQHFEESKSYFQSSTDEEEMEEQLSESEQSVCQEDKENIPPTMMLNGETIPKFKPAEPKKYMTAADFDRVCKQLQAMSTSYEHTAKRYEKAIETTEKTIKTCQRTEQKIDRFCRISENTL